MEKDEIIILIVASAIVLTLIGLAIAIWKQRDRRQPVEIVETRNQKRGKDGWLVLFIVTYKDGHTAEEWVDIADYKYETYHNWNTLHPKSEQEYSLEYNPEDDLKMTVKLRKSFNVCRPKTVLLSLLVIVILILEIYLADKFWAVIMLPVIWINGSANHSRVLNVEGQSVKYRVHRKRLAKVWRTPNGRRIREYDYIYREVVGKAETVEFRQNIIEKIFNAGHIKFIEDGTTKKHSVYGITNFDKTKQEIERIFKTHYI